MANNRTNGAKNGRAALEIENEALRRRLRNARKEIRDLREEVAEYHRALMYQFKKEARLEDWDDFDPADYTLTFEDICDHIEKELGICLRDSASSTPAKSKKRSRKSSVKRREPGKASASRGRSEK